MKCLESINPATGKVNCKHGCWKHGQLGVVVDDVTSAATAWSATTLGERIDIIKTIGELLKQRREQLATLITIEMGKVITESYAEIDKCIFTCDYYARHAPAFLGDEVIKTEATCSYVAYQPLGTILGIMPWNFPFWQVIRFAIPALLAGNTVLLKHASSVPQCSLAAEKLLHDAGIPGDVFRSLMIDSSQLDPLYKDTRIQGIAFTGSEAAGRHVAQQAGANLKKVVLELGGSDAFVVLEDADLELTAKMAVASRFFTSGQSCINAKRIIVVDNIREQFLSLFLDAVKGLEPGDPMDPESRIGPMARKDLRDKLHKQVKKCISMGAEPFIGCYFIKRPGFYYPPSILTNVKKGMPAYDEEIFGPVASVIYANDDEDAIRIANDTKFGLGCSVWTQDTGRGEQIAKRMESGMVYVNGLVKSDPRLPFGGIKNSGFGRELSRHGILEFANAKTISLS